MAETKDLQVQQETMSERFTVAVLKEYGSGVGDLQISQSQRRLAQNYFMAVDATLKSAEEKRLNKPAKFQDKLPVVWNNVDMELLSRNVIAAALIGWDPMQPNHISLIPYKNNTTKKYDIGFIPGYRGIQMKAIKYGLDVPDNVVVEIVYSNDLFKAVKKDKDNPVETYEFAVENPFDRGEIVGGFYYHEYKDNPKKNLLVVMSREDILKRKPRYASAEFWGGEKDEYVDGKKTGNKIQVDGWFKEMAWKTIYRAAYSNITIDPQLIDDDLQSLLLSEKNFKDTQGEREYEDHANSKFIDITPIKEELPVSVDTETGEITQKENTEESPEEEPDSGEPQQAPFMQ